MRNDKYNLIFCVLTYKNHNDLIEFINALKSNNEIDFTYKIVVVNNYADEESLKLIKEISMFNSCEFIESENNGYGAGNNIGINFIKDNYDYDYIVVCNPDTVIKNMKLSDLGKYKNEIIAPKIECLNGKLQNPMNFEYSKIAEKLMYIGYSKDLKFISYCGIALLKIQRYILNKTMIFMNKKERKIYACHGSYIILSKYAIEKLNKVFDEAMFLFCEEGDLARKAQSYNIDIIYDENINILHKEDGSMNLSNKNLQNILKESYIYYYEKWNKKGKK